MAIDYDPQEYIAALGNIGSGNNKPGESYAGDEISLHTDEDSVFEASKAYH